LDGPLAGAGGLHNHNRHRAHSRVFARYIIRAINRHVYKHNRRAPPLIPRTSARAISRADRRDLSSSRLSTSWSINRDYLARWITAAFARPPTARLDQRAQSTALHIRGDEFSRGFSRRLSVPRHDVGFHVPLIDHSAISSARSSGRFLAIIAAL